MSECDLGSIPMPSRETQRLRGSAFGFFADVAGFPVATKRSRLYRGVAVVDERSMMNDQRRDYEDIFVHI
jgi:hypothetical protein